MPQPDPTHSIFRALGYPVDAPLPTTHPTPTQALNAALQALEHPEARTAEAAVHAMLYAILHDANTDNLRASSDALRRAGYATERLLERTTDPDLARSLNPWTRTLRRYLGATSHPPLPWSVISTQARMRRLLAEADPINLRWQVYGAAQLRDELLHSLLRDTHHAAP